MSYTTQSGDTFDKIAKKLFGSEVYIKEMIKANPSYSNTVIFANGITLTVPDVDTTDDSTTTTAPWR